MAGSGKIFPPLAEGLVGGDQHGAPLVAGADELEQHAGLGLVLGDVCEVIEDEQVELVELGKHALEGEVAAGLLQLLGEVPLDAAAIAFGQFVLGERGEEARGRPALLSACSAICGQITLLAGSRSSVSSRLSPAESMATFFMPHLPSPARG